MRIRNTMLNSILALTNKIVTLVMVFVVRKFFVRILGNDYLGAEGFFSNVLGIFSLVDLGLGYAISFSLYKPIHEKNRDLLSAMMKIYKIAYIAVGVTILLLSFAFTPVIRFLFHPENLTLSEVNIFFLIYALGVAVTYFFSYNRTLLFALQKNYFVLAVDTIIKFLLCLTQILILTVTENYYFYLFSSIGFNLLGNILISVILNKEDCYDTRNVGKLPYEYKTELIEHMKALAITNIAWKGITSTDNIILSACVGVTELAKNTNYSLVVIHINSIVTALLGGATASIGDLISEGNKEKIREYFERYTFIYAIAAIYVSTGFFFVSDAFISAWVGSKLLFDKGTILVLAINIYLVLHFQPLAEYQNLGGLFVRYKPYSVIAFILNIGFSIVLSICLSTKGVFIGTLITYIFMIIVVCSLVCKYMLNIKCIEYYKQEFHYLIIYISCFLILLCMNCLQNENVVINLFLQFTKTTIVCFGVIWIALRNDQRMIFFEKLLNDIIKKLISKKMR